MQLTNTYDKGVPRVFELSIKYAWVSHFRGKKCITIRNAFQNVLNKSYRKPNKFWRDEKEVHFKKGQWNHSWKTKIWKDIRQIMSFWKVY